MNRRIRSKIQKRHGFKSWNQYWDYCLDREIARRCKGKTSGLDDWIYTVVSKKRRKRKILRLLVLKNVIPVGMNTFEFVSDPPIKFKPYEYQSMQTELPEVESPLAKMLEYWANGISTCSEMLCKSLNKLTIPAAPTSTRIIDSEEFHNELEELAKKDKTEVRRELLTQHFGKPATTAWEVPFIPSRYDRLYTLRTPVLPLGIATPNIPAISVPEIPSFAHMLEYQEGTDRNK